MITIFNRKELFVTLDMAKQAEIRRMLTQKGIDYAIKTVNLLSPSAFCDSRGRGASFGQNMEQSYEYIIYVRREDYAAAIAAINK